MMRLDEEGRAIRDFLFANYKSGIDIDDIEMMIDIIENAKEDWINEAVKEAVTGSSDKDVIDGYKEEIEYQRAQLKPYIKELAAYCDEQNIIINETEVLDNICQYGTKSSLYRIITEWKDIAEFADNIWDRIDDSYGRGLGYLRDDMCKYIMDELEDKTDIRKRITDLRQKEGKI